MHTTTEIDVNRAMPLRGELEPRPDRLIKLPLYRGYPVPWFVAWQDAAGVICQAGAPGAVPEFRCMDGAKWKLAVERRRCWVCGEPLGVWLTFVIGPMCGINRVTAEPPCHHECAVWSARNCPFLSKPHMVRRENDLPEAQKPQPGFAIMRNPGVTLLWTTRGYHLFGDGKGGKLIRIDSADRVEWYAEGRLATRAAVAHSVATGLPALMELAEAQDRDEPGAGAVAELTRLAKAFEAMYPAEPVPESPR